MLGCWNDKDRGRKSDVGVENKIRGLEGMNSFGMDERMNSVQILRAKLES